MAATKKDPTEAMRLKAGLYPDVDKGTACTQSSFKTGGKAFLFVGTQGGRFKAMFKLKQSIGEAERLSEKEPDNFDVGSTQWVTARFTAEKPMPQKLWKKWLDESYDLSCKPPKTLKKVTKKKSKH
jgi:predicted DNA-binding protein (MmcQ/YjbR family)